MLGYFVACLFGLLGSLGCLVTWFQVYLVALLLSFLGTWLLDYLVAY